MCYPLTLKYCGRLPNVDLNGRLFYNKKVKGTTFQCRRAFSDAMAMTINNAKSTLR